VVTLLKPLLFKVNNKNGFVYSGPRHEDFFKVVLHTTKYDKNITGLKRGRYIIFTLPIMCEDIMLKALYKNTCLSKTYNKVFVKYSV
jgi:hypothetical protein